MSVPVCDPVAVGAKETVTVPAAPAARLRLDGETVNRALLEVMLPTESVALPVLERAKSFTADDPAVTFPKDNEVNDNERTGPVPVPARETVAGLPGAL